MDVICWNIIFIGPYFLHKINWKEGSFWSEMIFNSFKQNNFVLAIHKYILLVSSLIKLKFNLIFLSSVSAVEKEQNQIEWYSSGNTGGDSVSF